MAAQVTVAKVIAHHAREGQMRSVEIAQAQVVKAFVVIAGKP